MNDTNKVFSMDDAEWQKIVKSIPVVCDLTETTAEGVVRQVLAAVFEKNGLPMDKLDAMVSTVIAHSQSDIGFTAMHGFAIPHGYVSGLEKLLVGIGVFRPGSSIDFNAIDGSRTHIVFVIVCSSPDHVGYRQFLARLCKCLISDDIVSRLASVSPSNDLETLLSGVGDIEEK
ncbi:MAG: PTS sugar transporter subunit IIA [Kiritimatiellae bacterium]|nr:PTS sugar transporter subunit IIA [Kiritimatiellia bacterium]